MKNFFKNGLAYVLIFAFLFRLVLVGFGTLDLDFNTFIAWSTSLSQKGFGGFYQGWSDYLPGYLYVLWFLGKVRGFLPDIILYKLPAILADVFTGYLIYKIVGKTKGRKWAVIAASSYLFNPAIWANSTLWGQVDSLTALFSLLAIFLFDKYFLLSAIALAVGTAIKPQAAFAAIVILFLMLQKRTKFKKAILYVSISLATFLATFLPFSQGNNFFYFFWERMKISFGQYPYTSVNAFNFWGIFGFWQGDFLVTQITGVLVVLIFCLAVGIKLFKKPDPKYLFLSVIFASTFLFLTRMHERHLLPVFAPLTVAAFISPGVFLPLLGFSIVYLLNLYYSFNWVSYDFKTVFSSGTSSFFSILSVAFWTILVASIFNPKFLNGIISKIIKYLSSKQVRKVNLPKVKLNPRTVKILLVSILLFSFATRVIKLGRPSEMYFDEIYHAFTAKLILHGDAKAWEWWNPHPEGFAYEWTHPPLAKLMMAGGMKVFGENSFGWRFPGVIFGTLSVYLVYLLSKRIFNDEGVGLISALIFSLDGLALSISRIGMNDTYFLFFVLASIYFFLKERDFWSAIFFGLALSSKWSTIWAIPILFVIWLHRKKKFRLSIFWFLILPAAVYVLTYTQMFLTGHDPGTFWGMQKQMWWYHTQLRATHAYGSSFLSWPFMIRPVYLYTSEEVQGFVSRIYAIGNPLIFWFGLISIVLSFFYALKERNRKLGLVVFSYLVFFIPWAASPRIMFLYHYLPSLPFLAIASGYVLRRNLKLVLPVLISLFILFVYFYPHWSGLNVPLWLDSSYYWFPSWR